MNKQQLAAKIWESANKMRSKIEANEYKDYILGFIFYKFLSDREVKYLKSKDWTDEYLPQLTEDDQENVESVQRDIGYFIAYENLFSTWIAAGSDFTADRVTTALSAFSRLINASHKKVFDGIFKTLETGLSKLGETSGARTKAIRDLLYLIKDIPMDGKQDYDVLGFIYEYLISNFAANAGKKAGEFYTPHEVSLLMSEIVAGHLQERSEIKIYDPTSGSGSLLINIGKCVARYINDDNRIKYYAQELKENTYNLTRMNLVMRGILPDNITTRNGDTLEEDWPYFEEGHPETYDPLYVDAVVSNPPYSQAWNPENKENDPRYSKYGVAPKGKADYAFLLHDLYHIKPDGIMTIVLPHGVLFRGGEEGEIRKNLIEKNKIDAIIGLPANIFFGTGIPTIIMVLRQQRPNTDVLIVDASKGFEKVGKNNKLRACDIKKIVDVVTARSSVDGFSRKVERQTIRDNGYNLNIPRYVDSSEKPETWDIYASMFGGIPEREIAGFNDYWTAFPGLQKMLFGKINDGYCSLLAQDLKNAVREHVSVKDFIANYIRAFQDFETFLIGELLDEIENINTAKEESLLAGDIFKRLKTIPLVDKYAAYQLLHENWNQIAVDLEIIQTEGRAAIKQVDPNMVTKKKDNKEQEVQDGWNGHILPFELVQKNLLAADLDNIQRCEVHYEEMLSEITSIIEELPEDYKDTLLNDDNDAFVAPSLKERCKSILEDIKLPVESQFNEYLSLSTKEKLIFQKEHDNIPWGKMQSSKNGTFTKKEISKYIEVLKLNHEWPEDSFDGKIIRASILLSDSKELGRDIREAEQALHIKTKETIENLTDEQAIDLLKQKWIVPLINNIHSLPETVISAFVANLEKLCKKYETTFADVEKEIQETENTLCGLLDELTGNEFDMQGLAELKKMLGGE